MEHIDDKLQVAIETYKWENYEKVYIDDLHADLKQLNFRIVQTKRNLELIYKSIFKWGSHPMFYRHENNSSNLMKPEDFNNMIAKRQMSCQHTKKLIEEMIEENFRLLFDLTLKDASKLNMEKFSLDSFSQSSSDTDGNSIGNMSDGNISGKSNKTVQTNQSRITLKSLKSSDKQSILSVSVAPTESQTRLFRPYKQEVDQLIWEKLLDAINNSIHYIKYEMENRRSHNTPLFEAKLELIDGVLTFTPNLELSNGSPTGMLGIITDMIAHILNMSDMLPLVNQEQPGVIETFSSFLNNPMMEEAETTSKKDRNVRIARLRNSQRTMQLDIMSQTRDAIREAIAYGRKFDDYKFLWRHEKSTQLQFFLRFGRLMSEDEVTKNEDGDFVQDSPEIAPLLKTFKDVIDYYNQVYDEINKCDTVKVLGNWLRINLKSLKQSLLNEVCKWSHLFKQYLQDKVIRDLKELEDFIIKSTANLNQNVTNEDAPTLLSILKTISQINERSKHTDAMFEPLREIVDLLKSYDVEFEDFVEDQFAQLPESWITLKKLLITVKRNIAPVQAYQVDLIKKHINLFDIRAKLFYESFMASKLLKFPCAEVYKLCDLIHADLVDMENQCAALREQAVHFNLNPPEEGKMNYCRKIVRLLKHVWDFHFAVLSCVDDWKQTAWKRINVDDMETECKRFSKVNSIFI